MNSSNRAVLKWDPYHDPDDGDAMQFRLTYEGPLVSTQDDPRPKQTDPRREQKHRLRQAFHPQLKQLWATHPVLRASQKDGQPLADWLAGEYPGFGYRYVPLVRGGAVSLLCAVHVLFLRREVPGGVIRGGDLDNRMKTLYDGLRMPNNPAEMKDIQPPQNDEDPFFVLLENDELISHTSVETDMLLDSPTTNADRDVNNVRLVITVKVRPYNVHMENLSFV